MTKLEWDLAGTRLLEYGIDRGVVFVDGGNGAIWNGLTSVEERTEGGEVQPYYVDGFKYLNVAQSSEFAASVTAYSTPPEFDVCVGRKSISEGLYATNQWIKRFDFSYRTLLGDDLDISRGYKLHLVYNALAKPSSYSNSTNTTVADPSDQTYDISTTPVKIPGYKPTSHLVIDSRTANRFVLGYLESILYGTVDTSGRMPSIDEVIALFGWLAPDVDFPINILGEVESESETITNLFTNPSFEAGTGSVEVRRNMVINPSPTSPSSWSPWPGSTVSYSSGAIQVVTDGTGPGQGVQAQSISSSPASVASGGIWVNAPSGTLLYAQTRANNSPAGATTTNFTANGQWQFVKAENSPTAGAAGAHVVMVRTREAVAVTFQLKQALIEASPVLLGPYFDGSTPPKVRQNYFGNPAPAMTDGFAPGRATQAITAEGLEITATESVSNVAVRTSYGATATPAHRPKVTAGVPVTVSLDGKATKALRIIVGFYDAGGAVVGASVSSPSFSGAGSFERVALAVTPPATAVSLWIYVGFQDAPTVGEKATFRRFMVGDADSYFDGSSGAPAGFATAWEGTPNASASYVYDSDLTPSWTGTANASESKLTGIPIAGIVYTNCVVIKSTRWSKQGLYSARVIPTTATSASYAYASMGGVGPVGTALASIHLEEPLTGGLATYSRSLRINGSTETTDTIAPNEAGEYVLRTVNTGTPTTVVFGHGGRQGSGDVWWDCLGLFQGNYTGDAIIPGQSIYYKNHLLDPVCDGTEDASTSHITYYDFLVDQTATPGDTYIIGTELWTYHPGGYWFKVSDSLPV